MPMPGNEVSLPGAKSLLEVGCSRPDVFLVGECCEDVGVYCSGTLICLVGSIALSVLPVSCSSCSLDAVLQAMMLEYTYGILAQRPYVPMTL